jgi:trimethylamine:corrinoid methyltransferase-like protein
LKRPKLEILETQDIRKIIAAAYDLLENFGVMVDNDEALQILEGGGARIDIKEIMRIMKSYARSKGADALPHVSEWVG